MPRIWIEFDDDDQARRFDEHQARIEAIPDLEYLQSLRASVGVEPWEQQGSDGEAFARKLFVQERGAMRLLAVLREEGSI